jgi:predicted Zn finger-like uncharacterized protein
MYITCPQCNFSKEVPDERIPPQARSVTCPRCKVRFPLLERKAAGASAYESVIGKLESAAITPVSPLPPPAPEEKQELIEKTDIPWESASREGMFVSVVSTIVGVTFSPTKFYTSMNPTGKISFPLAFAMITGGVGWLLNMFWEYLFISGLLSQLDQPWVAWLSTGTFAASAVAIPLLITIELFFYSIITHLGLVILRGNSRPFKATFKVMAYAYAPKLFSVIPGLGILIGAIWMIVVATIGLSTVHHISKGKACLSQFLILIIMMAVGIIISTLLPLLFEGNAVL